MPTETSTLTALREGQWARVSSILTEGSMRRRLQDIGLIEGTRVKCLHRSPFGDPAAFWIRGAVFALRREDSDAVLVHPEG